MPQHVVIVGGGVIGLCAAWYCSERGWRVTVVERGAERRDGCSFGNAGLVVPSHFVPLAAPGMVARGLKWMWQPGSPFYVQPRLSAELASWGLRFWRAATQQRVERAAPVLRDLHLAGRALYEQLARDANDDFGFVPDGLLMLCRTPHGLDEESHAAKMAERLGIEAQMLDGPATCRLEPDMPMDVCGSVFYPGDCHLTPARLVESLQQRLAARGCEFRFNCEVESLERKTRRVTRLITSKGPTEADEVVLAGGIWSTGLAKTLGLALPMQAGKGYSLTLDEAPQLPKRPAILTEARVAVTPMGSSLRFGGTMELSGLNQQIRPERVRGIIRSALAYYPQLREEDFAGARPWCGLRPCSPDGLPYLGRPAAYDNLTIATGHAMLGVSLGPITGRIVADLIAGERPAVEIEMLKPDRYG